MSRKNFGQYIHDKLVEPPGQEFVYGKWRFWFLAVAFLSVVNSALTWLIFRDDAENFSGPILLSVGALVAWLCVCALHYSDSANRRLATSVSVIDSIALLAVVVHFGGLLYVYGHHRTLRSAEARYEVAAEKFNAEAKQVSTDNVEIARSAERIATETTKAERLRNDTAYQTRKAAEAGAVIRAPRSASGMPDKPALSTSQIELERPVKPAESSAAFLTKWDWLIRAANCAELLLACLTLILIRNVSARSNTHAPAMRQEEFLPFASTSARSPVAAPAFRKTHVSYEQEKTPKTHVSFSPEGLRRLRETLRDISFRLAGISFKADVKADAVWIRAMRANNSTQETVASAKARLSILDDATVMERGAFRERLERFLIQNEFPIE